MDFYIVNNVDRPDERHVAEAVDSNTAKYLHEDLRNWGLLGLTADSSTLSEFGFDFTELGGGMVFFEMSHRPSTATYSNGKTRHWQGKDRFFLRRRDANERCI